MFELVKIIIPVIVGFVLGQMVKFFWEPFYELRKVIGATAETLIYHANVYGNPGGVPRYYDEAQKELRKRASELWGHTYAVPIYGFWSMIRLLPTKENIKIAYENLIGLSNSVYQGERKENKESQKAIVQALGIGKLFEPRR